MKIGFLTSSRADYGIYLPLLKKLEEDTRFHIEIIAFGMHLQMSQGNTIKNISDDGFETIHRIGTMPEDDGVNDIVQGYGQLIIDFVQFWSQNAYDLIFALGDRWEMSAAVQSSIPFEVKLAHIHGGETTLGAIDNIFRHQITLASFFHFTAADLFSERVKSILGHSEGVYTVGSISLEDLGNVSFPQWKEVKKQFKIPFDDFVLVTFHPESVGIEGNETYSEIAYRVLEGLIPVYNVLITGANSDVLGSLYNKKLRLLEQLFPSKVKWVDALGKLNYFKAMEQSQFLLGNTSSGIIEAASFQKWVVNVGNRQKGRLRSDNVIDVPFDYGLILDRIKRVENSGTYYGSNKYVKNKSVETIINIIVKDAGL